MLRTRHLTLTLTFDLDPELWSWPQSKIILNKQWSPNTIFSVWPWLLTYDLDLQSHPSLGQGRPHTKSQDHRSNGSNSRAQTRHTHGQTDATKYIIYLLCQSYTVDNYHRSPKINEQPINRVSERIRTRLTVLQTNTDECLGLVMLLLMVTQTHGRTLHSALSPGFAMFHGQ